RGDHQQQRPVPTGRLTPRPASATIARMGTLLIACPSCSCHAFARETRCPSCGAPLRAADGSIQRTAGAVLLGLSLTVTTAACGSRSGGGAGGAGRRGPRGPGALRRSPPVPAVG